METNAKVKLRGVQVGRVASITGGREPVELKLEIDPDQIKHIPANVEAQIQATTVFGAKFVDLVYPSDPSPKRLQAGQVLHSRNVSTEVNTVFENVVGVLDQIDPPSSTACCPRLPTASAARASGSARPPPTPIRCLLALNPRSETVRADWQALKGFSDTYSVAAQDILATLNAASTTSATVTANAKQLDALLLATIGLSNSGIEPARTESGQPDQGHQRARADDEPVAASTTRSTPACWWAPSRCWTTAVTKRQAAMGDHSWTLDCLRCRLFLGDDPYRYPDNLPVVGAKGGPGGKPGCGSLPDVDQELAGASAHHEHRFRNRRGLAAQPGYRLPWLGNYLPVTRAVPEPPSIRNLFGGPAPGPIPYPGAPAYGAPMYAPDGTPLWPGLPPAPPPGAPQDPGPRPGSEPFVVPAPAQMQPTPLPPIPLPLEAAPSP